MGHFNRTNSMLTIKNKMNKVIGYIIGILGLILLVWNAYLYLSKSDFIFLPSGVQLILGILLGVGGAALIRKDKNKNDT